LNRETKITYLILFAILLLASVLRLVHPTEIPFTNDEFNALLRTHFSSFSELIKNGVITDAHPAGVQVFLYYWTKLFGYSEIVVKLPFIICGICSVFYIFRIGKAWFNPTVGLVCAAFLAALEYSVMYSQIARPYASGLFFALAMVYYWNNIVFKPEERFYRNTFLYILFSTLCIYNHYFSFLVALMIGVTGLLFIPKKYVLKYMAAGIIVFILYIPHLHIFFYQFGIGGLPKLLAPPENDFIIEYLKYVFDFSPFIMAFTGFLFLYGVVYSIREKITSPNYLVISFCWFLIPFLTGFFYSRYVSPVLQYSVLIFSFPFLLLFLFGWLPEMQSNMKVILVFAICLLGIDSLIAERKYYSIFYSCRYEQIVLQSNHLNNYITTDNCLSLIQNEAELPEKYYAKKDNVDTTAFHFIENSPKKQPVIQLIEQEHKLYLSWGTVASGDPVYLAIFLHYYPYLVKEGDYYGGTFYLFSSLPGKGVSPYIFESVNTFRQDIPHWPPADKTFLVDSVYGSKSPSYKMDSLHEWAPSFTDTLSKMVTNNHNTITISVGILPLENLKDVFIVSELKSQDKSIYWNATPVNDCMVDSLHPVWQKAYHAVRLSDIDLNHPNIVAKVGTDKDAKKEFEILNMYFKCLSEGRSARTVVLTDEEKVAVADLHLLTIKPVLYVCNVDQSSLKGNKYTDAVKEAVKDENAEVLIIDAGIEAEITQLESAEDRKVFLDDMGLDEPGVNKLIKAAYKLLNLSTYFTAGEVEVRAWTIHKGDKAPQAAGVIHTDFEKGFIKAEVIGYDDYIQYGSEAACRDAGKLMIQGKDYVVKDGDVMHFRFNV